MVGATVIKKKKVIGCMISLLCIISALSMFTYVVKADSVYVVNYQDPYGDVLYYDEGTQTHKNTTKKPYIDLKTCYVGNNNTTLFLKTDYYADVKDASGIVYQWWIDSYETREGGFGRTDTVTYENGNATFYGYNGTEYPVVGYSDGSSLFFEVPIDYLEEGLCIWNGSYLKIGPHTDETSDEWYTECIPKFTYNLIGYREQEPYPRAYIECITPNPAIQGDTVYFSGYGVASGNASIVEYEWTDYDWSTQQYNNVSSHSSFNMSNFSPCTHFIFFRVKDSNGNWSKQIVEGLTVNLPEDAPVIEILSPSDGGTVNGEVTMTYNAVAYKGSFIKKVEMKVKNGNWFTIFSTSTESNTTSLSYIWNSKSVSNGFCPIWLRATDSRGYTSEADCVGVYVNNGNVNNGGDGGILNQLQQNKTLIIPLIIILGILIALVTVKMKIKKKKKSMIDEESMK